MYTDNKYIRVCLYHFITNEWTELATGIMGINTIDKTLKIDLDKQIDWNRWPQKKKMLSSLNNQEILFNFSEIREVEEDEKDHKIAYFWYNKEPLAISFLDESKCKQFIDIFVTDMEVSAINQNHDDLGQLCLKDIMNQSQSLISNIFISSNFSMIDSILDLVKVSLDQNLDDEGQKNFSIIKIAIRVSDTKTLKHLISGQHYETILRTLKYNTFNNKQFDYLNEFKTQAQFSNSLGFQDEQIMQCYQMNCRAKFLKDCGACTFSELETDRSLINIITSNNQIILNKIASKYQNFQALASLSQQNPYIFLNVVYQLWEIFSTICIQTDVDTIIFKDKFWRLFIQYGLHLAVIKAAYKQIQLVNQSKSIIRLHQKWMNSLSIFFNYDWNQIQEWLSQNPQKVNFCQLLLQLFYKTTDESLMQSVMIFVRDLTIPNENRLKVHYKISVMFLNSFFSKIWTKMQKSPHLIELYISQIIRIYKIQPIRTRRILIEQQILESLDESIRRSKIVTINVIKLLQAFFIDQNQDIFRYLQMHKIFKLNLKQQYLRNRWCDNIISGCFKALKNMMEINKYKQGLYYLEQIISPPKQTDPSENSV